MSTSARSLLIPGLALATAGAVALGPALVAPAALSAAQPAAPLPAVHIENIALAGIGQDIYNAVTPYVQYVVGGVSYIVNFLPIIGAPIAAQININYFQGIQPIVAATVNYLAGVIQDPLNFIATTSAYATALFDIGYNWVSAEAVWIGLPPLPPLPAAAVAPRAPARSVARSQAVPKAPRSAVNRVSGAASVSPRAPKTVAGQARKTAKPTRASAAVS